MNTIQRKETEIKATMIVTNNQMMLQVLSTLSPKDQLEFAPKVKASIEKSKSLIKSLKN